MGQPEHVAKLMDGFLRYPIQESRQALLTAIKLRIQPMNGYERPSSRTLGQPEDEVQTGHVKIHSCDREYRPTHPFEDISQHHVRIILSPPRIVCFQGNLHRKPQRDFSQKRPKSSTKPGLESEDQLPWNLTDGKQVKGNRHQEKNETFNV